MSNNRTFFLSLLPAVFTALFLFACAPADPLTLLPKLESGAMLEQFVPKDAVFVATYFPNGEDERARSVSLFSSLVKEGPADVLQYLFKGSGVENYNDLFKQIFPDENFPPSIISFWPNAKTGNFDFFYAGVSGLPEGFSLPSEDGQNFPFIGVRDGMVIVASRETLLDELGDGDFLKDETYLAFLKKMPKRFSGYLYKKPGVSQDNITKPFLELVSKSSFTSYSAQEDGLVFLSFQKAEAKFVSEARLSKKIPVKNAVMIFEGYDAARLIEMEKELLSADPFFRSLYGENIFSSLEESTGVSYENDLKPFLGGNFVLAVEDHGRILPGVSIWIDAKAHVQGANKVIQKLDEALSTMIVFANAGFAASEKDSEENVKDAGSGLLPFERKDIDYDGSPLHQIRFFPGRLPKEGSAIPLFEGLEEAWALTYGVTKDSLLVFSTRTEFPTNRPGTASSVLSNDAFYKSFEPKIKGYEKTDFFYLQTAPVISYLERVVDLGKSSGNISADELKAFEIFKKYFSTVKGALSGTRVKSGFIETKTFFSIK